MNLLINGLITGAVFAIAASGLVVTYSTSGVFNFAHGALGMLSRVRLLGPARQRQPQVAAPAARDVGRRRSRSRSCCSCSRRSSGRSCIASSIRGLQDTSEIVKLVVPISVLLAAIGLANWVWKPTDSHSIQPFFGADHKVTWFGVVLLWHDLTILVVAIALAIGLPSAACTARGSACRCAAVVDDRPLRRAERRPARSGVAGQLDDRRVAVGAGRASSSRRSRAGR